MKSLYDLIDKKSPCFVPCKWVAQVNIIGGQEREKLVLTPSRCKVWPSIPQVQQVILSSNLTSYWQPNAREKNLDRLAGKYKNVEELRNLVVSSKNGIQVRYRILPMFKMDKKQLKRLLVLIKRAIILQIVKQSDANAVAVSEQCIKPSRN
jgi:HAE1 family hydrophobic/amphiphilic exporter-1